MSVYCFQTDVMFKRLPVLILRAHTDANAGKVTLIRVVSIVQVCIVFGEKSLVSDCTTSHFLGSAEQRSF